MNQKKQTVLLADDNKQTVALIRKFFTKAQDRGDLDCEIIEAYDGEEAIQMLDIAQPEIILCDISMPRKNGFEVLKHFNNFSRVHNLYCFFCFLTSAKDEKIRAFKEGAMGFVAKDDINYFVMTLQLKSWLRLVELEREAAATL